MLTKIDQVKRTASSGGAVMAVAGYAYGVSAYADATAASNPVMAEVREGGAMVVLALLLYLVVLKLIPGFLATIEAQSKAHAEAIAGLGDSINGHTRMISELVMEMRAERSRNGTRPE